MSAKNTPKAHPDQSTWACEYTQRHHTTGHPQLHHAGCLAWCADHQQASLLMEYTGCTSAICKPKLFQQHDMCSPRAASPPGCLTGDTTSLWLESARHRKRDSKDNSSMFIP
ncbi:hypothetical protein M8818_000202 [Zalaria obscura]|uniref:Uncharacterized protein n=1 Tax=Zalaria obscura TaxID=2024903 RepID=A0ACC3SPG0_9PEZI